MKTPPPADAAHAPPDLAALRALAAAEGVSLLALAGIAVPLKYAAGLPGAVALMGPVHGVCFVLYLIALADAVGTGRLGARAALVALGAAFVPGGSFVVARRLRAGGARGAA
jgi:integral membrane protein